MDIENTWKHELNVVNYILKCLLFDIFFKNKTNLYMTTAFLCTQV